MPGPRAREAEEALQATERAAAARARRLRELVGVDVGTVHATVRASNVAVRTLEGMREQFARLADCFRLSRDEREGISSGFREADELERRIVGPLPAAAWVSASAPTPAFIRRPVELDRCTCPECMEFRGQSVEAAARAKRLLLSWLDEEQARSYENGDGFLVKGASGTTYRIWVAAEAPTYVLDGPYAGSEVCVQLNPRYDPADAALARKLLIETDEEAFLSIANGLRSTPAAAPVQSIQLNNPRVEVVQRDEESGSIVYRVLLDVENVVVDRVVERQ